MCQRGSQPSRQSTNHSSNRPSTSDRCTKQVMAAFQKEQGRAAAEERLDAYMRERTVAGVPMLDPTGE
jgi:hypothetical protein